MIVEDKKLLLNKKSYRGLVGPNLYSRGCTRKQLVYIVMKANHCSVTAHNKRIWCKGLLTWLNLACEISNRRKKQNHSPRLRENSPFGRINSECIILQIIYKENIKKIRHLLIIIYYVPRYKNNIYGVLIFLSNEIVHYCSNDPK